MGKKKLSDEQRIEQRDELIARMEDRRITEFNDPNNCAQREWIKAAFKNDIDQIAHFAAGLMRSNEATSKENEVLAKRLNEVYFYASGLSNESNAKAHQKNNIANSILKHDPEDPVAKTFLSALSVSRTLNAQSNSYKAHANRRKAKEFVAGEWAAHKAVYANNKSAFSRDYVRRVLREHDVIVTEKQMREVWLKDAPSAR